MPTNKNIFKFASSFFAINAQTFKEERKEFRSQTLKGLKRALAPPLKLI